MFQSSNIFFSFYEFSQMLVNPFLKILFLDETRFYTSNAWCFQLCCSHQDVQGQRLAILPFLDFNTIKWAWWIQPSSVFITLQWNNHRVSIEGKSPYNEYHIVDSRRKIFPSNLMTFWATIYHAWDFKIEDISHSFSIFSLDVSYAIR